MFLVLTLLVLVQSAAAHVLTLNATVPPFTPDGEDAYICTVLELPEKPHRLIGVLPQAKQEIVHHILLYGWYTATHITIMHVCMQI